MVVRSFMNGVVLALDHDVWSVERSAQLDQDPVKIHFLIHETCVSPFPILCAESSMSRIKSVKVDGINVVG